MQLNAIFRLKKCISQKELEVALNSFIYSNFNYYPLVQHFGINKSIEKIESKHKRCLRLTLSDYKSDYKTLPDKSGKESTKNRRTETLAIEIFKTVNKLNPNFMKIFLRLKQILEFDFLIYQLKTAILKSTVAKVSQHWNQKYGMHYLKI